MSTIHAALAWLAGGSVVVLLAIAIWTAAGRTRGYGWLDRAVLGQVALTAVAGLAGVVSYLGARPPGDPLHLLYGGVACAAPLVARATAQGRDARSVGRWVAVAAAVAIGATIRSFMTGR